MKKIISICIFTIIMQSYTHIAQSAIACTMEARMCPDGSYVGRNGPNCEFTPCPADTHVPVMPITPIQPKTCPYISSTLRFGQKNTQVYDLQNFLFTIYNVNMKPTGYFGTVTKTYVIRFQKERGLKADGIVGPITKSIMRTLCGSDNTTNNIPSTCKVWFDGCNTCSRTSSNGEMMCTMMACIWSNDKASGCLESF